MNEDDWYYVPFKRMRMRGKIPSTGFCRPRDEHEGKECCNPEAKKSRSEVQLFDLTSEDCRSVTLPGSQTDAFYIHSDGDEPQLSDVGASSRSDASDAGQWWKN